MSAPGKSSRPRSGFTMVELVAAIAVLSIASLLVIGMMLASRRASGSLAERRLAGDITQGALEALRTWPAEMLKAKGRISLPLPTEAERLAEASMSVDVKNWGDAEELRHVRVTLRWRSRRGVAREVIREGLIGAHRVR